MQSNFQRPYQGYPYVNPPVNDAPSIDSATASRWTNLPRRQVELPVQRAVPTAHYRNPNGTTSGLNVPRKSDPEPMVYIDVPEACGSSVSTEQPRRLGNHQEAESNGNDKREPTDDPVVYIDIPDNSGSGVAQVQNEDQPEPEYVQNTIFFNPFENRRIEMHKNSPDQESETSSMSSNEISQQNTPSSYHPPVRPNTLNLYGCGTSSAASSSSMATSSTPGLPGLMSKETMLYGRDQNGFPISPIPVSEFPEPPPSYSDIDRTTPVVDPREVVVEQPRAEPEPPRTQVILPSNAASTPIGIPNPHRKYLTCPRCGIRVHTLVIKENGLITHCVGIAMLLICMIPCMVFVYCTNYFKVKNHYCPSCNSIIGYQHIFTNKKIVYVDPN